MGRRDTPPSNPPIHPRAEHEYGFQGTFVAKLSVQGERVDFAGKLQFGSVSGGRGELRWSSQGSGHYRPARGFEGNSPFPKSKFRPESFGGGSGTGPQLPLFQPSAW